MTTIAWDGHSLAADQCSWSCGTRRRVRKVFHVKHKERGDLLVAFCGFGAFCLRVKDWLEGGEKPNPSEFFNQSEIGSQCAVVIDRKNRVWTIGNDLYWQQLREKIYAQGAGQEFAFGALEAGATAAQAIRIAMKRSDYAGLGVDSISFRD